MKISKLFLIIVLQASVASAQGVYGYFSDCIVKWMPRFGSNAVKGLVSQMSPEEEAYRKLRAKKYEEWCKRLNASFENYSVEEQNIVINYCLKHFDKAINTRAMWDVIFYRPETAPAFASLAVQHFDMFCRDSEEIEDASDRRDPSRADILWLIMSTDKSSIKTFLPLVVKNFDRMGARVIKTMVSYDPSLASEFAELAVKHSNRV